jgi:hypothetical protein
MGKNGMFYVYILEENTTENTYWLFLHSIIAPLNGSDYTAKKKCGDKGTIGKSCSKIR